MTRGRVSIIITCYNYARFVAEAIDSALAQSYPNIEIIVVDDGSTDDTPDVLKQYDQKVTCLRVANGGVVRARNLGFEHSTGDFVCFLDADDKLHADFVKVLVESLKQNDDKCVLAYCDFQLIGSAQRMQVSGRWSIYRLLYTNYLIPCAMMTRSSFTEVGQYSDYMAGKFGFEDWELWVKYADYGYRGQYVPGPYFIYRLHGSGRNLAGEQHRRQQLALIQSHHSKLYGRIDVVMALLAQRLWWRGWFELKRLAGRSKVEAE
jgi:glycosyltransferase involved in cell wall biosynthesis